MGEEGDIYNTFNKKFKRKKISEPWKHRPVK